MRYSEKLMWILDKVGEKYDTLEEQESLYGENREFVHSLGLKCDSVGWCSMDLSLPKVEEIFEKISAFCAEKGWRARCIYTRQFAEAESDWYELVPTDFKDNTVCGRTETAGENGQKLYVPTIKAFQEMSTGPKSWGRNTYVPERFREFCLKNGIDGLDFCWLRDKGKYQAEQYFEVFGTRPIPRMAVDFDIKDKKHIQAAGGMLPRVAAVFHELQMIDLPDCYLAEDLPESGIACAYIPATFSCSGRYQILIHRDAAKLMVEQKAVSPAALRPVPVVGEVPGGYILAATSPVPRPRQDFLDAMLAEYENLKNTSRPTRQMTEKDALKILRLAKKERKEDFQKALPKAKKEALADTAYAPLAPYYSVANGGFLSDEYRLLSFDEAVAENEEFHRALAAGELAEKPAGVVIGKCADGDAILLCGDEVIRFSHEAPETNAQWPSLPQFIVDAINE